jgi:hypothetical protein
MGHEIYYCSVCREQIRSSDFDSGKAFQLENRRFCLKCGPEVLRTLPKDKVKDIFRTIAGPAKPTPVETPEAPPPRSAPSRNAAPQRPIKSWVIPAAVAGVLVGIVGFGLLLRSPEAPEPAPLPAPVPGPVSRPSVPPIPVPERKPVPAPAPEPATSLLNDKERVARDALRKARAWAAANPSDFDGAVRKFQDACFLATGTSCLPEATQEMELYRRKQRDFFAAELSSLEPEVKAACAEERFMKALDLLRLAKDRYGSAEWQLLVGKRVREINDGAFQKLNLVKEEALEAQSRGDEEKVKALRARVASWGVERFVKDFRDALDR